VEEGVIEKDLVLENMVGTKIIGVIVVMN